MNRGFLPGHRVRVTRLDIPAGDDKLGIVVGMEGSVGKRVMEGGTWTHGLYSVRLDKLSDRADANGMFLMYGNQLEAV